MAELKAGGRKNRVVHCSLRVGGWNGCFAGGGGGVRVRGGVGGANLAVVKAAVALRAFLLSPSSSFLLASSRPVWLSTLCEQ